MQHPFSIPRVALAFLFVALVVGVGFWQWGRPVAPTQPVQQREHDRQAAERSAATSARAPEQEAIIDGREGVPPQPAATPRLHIRVLQAATDAPLPNLHLALVELDPFADLDVDAHLSGRRAPLALATTGADGVASVPFAESDVSVRVLDPAWRAVSKASFEGLVPGAQVELRAAPAARAHGRVLDAGSLQPIHGAVLLVNDTTESALAPYDAARRTRALTDADGSFTLGGLAPDTDLRVTVAGAQAVAQALALRTGAAGTVLELGDLLLARGLQLDVFVTQQDGAPVQGARVGLEGHQPGEVQRGFHGTATDAQGRAVFRGLAPGVRKLLIEAPGLARARVGFELEAGSAHTTVHVPLDAGATFQVLVRAADGSAVQGATVTLVTSAVNGERRVADTDAKGGVVFEHVGQPVASLFVRAAGFAAARVDGVGAGTLAVVELERGFTLRGRLVLNGAGSGSAWRAGAESVAGRSPQLLRTMATPSAVDADGRFEVPNIGYGPVAVAARSNAGESLLAVFTFVDQAEEHRVEPDRPLRIAGIVTDARTGAPLEGVEVLYLGLETMLVPEAEAGAFRARTDAAGRYSLPAVPDGTGFFVARTPGYATQKFSPELASNVQLHARER